MWYLLLALLLGAASAPAQDLSVEEIRAEAEAMGKIGNLSAKGEAAAAQLVKDVDAVLATARPAKWRCCSAGRNGRSATVSNTPPATMNSP
jgi:hypothetical protein